MRNLKVQTVWQGNRIQKAAVTQRRRRIICTHNQPSL